MIRGTNAQFKFKLPYPKGELAWVTIKFWQPSNPKKFAPITKTLIHCDGPDDAKELYVSLTIDDTKKFSAKYKAVVQLGAQHADSGTVFGCRPTLFTVYPMHDEILGEDPTLPDPDEDPTLPTPNENGWVVLDGEAISD